MPEKRALSVYLPFVALAFLVFFIRLPDLFTHYHDWDEAAMMSQAWAMTQGEVLYADIFQIHPVFQIALFVPFFLIFSPDSAPHAIKALNALLIFGGALIVYRIIRNWLEKPSTALIGAILFVVGFRWDWAQSSHGELYAIFPLLAAAYLLLFAKKRTSRSLLGAGVLFGVAFYFKQTALFDAAALGLCALHRGGRKKFAMDAGRMALGFASVTALVSLYFLMQGAWREAMVSMWVRPAFSYSRLSDVGAPDAFLSHRIELLKTLAYAILTRFPILLAAAAVGAVPIVRRLASRKALPREEALFLYMAVWWAADILGLVLIGRFYPHYLLQLIAPLVLLSIFVVRKFHHRLRATAAHTLLILALVLGFRHAALLLPRLSTAGWRTPEVRRSLAVADYVRSRTGPEDRIFLYKVWNLDIFYLAGRLSNNGIYMFIDMVADHMHDYRLEEEKRKEFLANLPAVVLVDTKGWLFPSAEKFFKKVLREHYHYDATVSDIRVYGRKKGA